MMNEKMNGKTKEETLLENIKTVFLFSLTFLVVLNTFVLYVTLPLIGHHIAPNNQSIVLGCQWILLIMGGCISLFIMLGIAYATVRIVQGREIKIGGDKTWQIEQE